MNSVVAFPIQSSSVRHPRAGFESIPHDISRSELLRFFTFSDNDRNEILQCRGDVNRIGFALLLGGIRLLGRFPHDFELIPHSLITHICEQLFINDIPLFISYPPKGRRPTRHEHTERIRTYLGLLNFTDSHKELVTAFVDQLVRQGERPHLLLNKTEQMLRQHHLVLPGVTVLERLIRTIRNKTEDAIYQELYVRLDSSTVEKILDLLEVKDGEALNMFQQLSLASRGPSTDALEREMDSLEFVQQLLPSSLDLTDVNPHLLERLASIINGMSTQSVNQFNKTKGVALLLCWLWRLRTQITDTALTISNDLIAGTLRRAKNRAQKEYKRQQKRYGPILKVCGEVIELVLDETIPVEKVRPEIVDRWSHTKLQLIAQECKELGQSVDDLYMDLLRNKFSYIRRFSPRLLDTFVLKSTVANEPVLKAAQYLKECNNQQRRFNPVDAPIEFVPKKWKDHVCPKQGEVDRGLWEICLLEQLRLSLKSGNVHVPHSRTFQPAETYLISREKWEKEKISIVVEHQLPLDFNNHWPKVESLLKENLRTLDQSYPDNKHLTIADNQLHIGRLEKLVVPSSVDALKKEIHNLIQRRPLTDLLLEVHSWTGFLKAFTRITSGRAVTDVGTGEILKILTCLIAEACNIELTDMELAGPSLTRDQLEDTHFNYIREETLALASSILVNFLLGQWLPTSWGQGYTSSSDAKVYGVPLKALNATYNPKYFASARKGVGIYTHISDIWIPFYTQVIMCNMRQAPYMIDGLLYHNTRLEPREHYTDTHGYTDAIFAISHLLGIRFAPRIKDIPDMRLWCLPDETQYQYIGSVFAGQINVNLIKESWDEILRLIASIRSGEVRASLIVNKISAGSHKSKLYRSLQEFGRLLKTAHIAEYLFSEEFRRRILLGLNKGESVHALAGDIRFVRNAELRDLTYEDQLNAASSLNLILAAIVCWNTVHMQGCLKKLEADEYPVNSEDLKFLSPLIRKHIGIYGQYRFDVDKLEKTPSASNIIY
jgi:TnpA family transposase